MNKKKRKRIVKRLRLMADGSENRMPLLTYIDPACIRVMRQAAKAIKKLERKK